MLIQECQNDKTRRRNKSLSKNTEVSITHYISNGSRLKTLDTVSFDNENESKK